MILRTYCSNLKSTKFNSVIENKMAIIFKSIYNVKLTCE